MEGSLHGTSKDFSVGSHHWSLKQKGIGKTEKSTLLLGKGAGDQSIPLVLSTGNKYMKFMRNRVSSI